MLVSMTAFLLAMRLAKSRASTHDTMASVESSDHSSNEDHKDLFDFLAGLFDGEKDDEGTSIIDDSILDIFGDDENDFNPTFAPTSIPTTEIPTPLTSARTTAVRTSVPIAPISVSPTGSLIPDRFNCTGDSQACPDGSFVSRDPRNSCTFQECSTLPSAPRMTPNGSIEDEVIFLSWVWLGPMVLTIVLCLWLWALISISCDITQKDVVFDEEAVSDAQKNAPNAKVDWEVIDGFREFAFIKSFDLVSL